MIFFFFLYYIFYLFMCKKKRVIIKLIFILKENLFLDFVIYFIKSINFLCDGKSFQTFWAFLWNYWK